MTSRLQGRVALVTGGARGIGRGIVERLAAEGAAVGVLDLKPELAQEAAAAIRAAGGRAVAFGGDVAQRDTVFAAAQGLQHEFGRLDILVSNAMWVRYGPIEDITPETLQRMVGTGFASVVWGIQAAATLMERGGCVVNIASAAAFLGLPQGLLYCGVKAGVLGLTRSAAVDLGPRGIRVNAVAPGSVPTEGVKLNIAAAVCFLASDDSSWVTGECIKVEGGTTTAFL
jgi:NAD(P)-dependent dehydrogenase (short-subunit alcohol dehydrogenase family)